MPTATNGRITSRVEFLLIDPRNPERLADDLVFLLRDLAWRMRRRRLPIPTMVRWP